MKRILLVQALLAAVTPLAAVAQTPAVPAAVDGTQLDVVAEGRTTRTPDLALIRAGVVSTAPTAADALSTNAAAMTRALAALKRAGVADRDVQTASVSLSPQYRYTDNQPPVITGYQASNSVSIRFRDIAKAGAILDSLVAVGANQIDGPTLSLDNPDAALDEARTDAVRRARARAELYAKAAGLTVARILSISEAGSDNGTTPRPPVLFAARGAADVASLPVRAGETDVTATVMVRFLLK